MPAAYLSLVGEDYRGRLSCQRKFGCPTCLDPHERVWLVIEAPAHAGQATLNGQRIGSFQVSTETAEFEITARLHERNGLVLDFDFNQPASANAFSDAAGKLLFKDVRLEIRG